jgi:hypothetical protein
MAHDSCLECPVKSFHEAVGGRMIGCCPWSVVMVCGQPKRDIQPDSRPCATVTVVMSCRDMTSGQRVKRSTAVRHYVNPADDGRGPIRSMWTCRKRAAGNVKSPKGVAVCRETLER